MKTISHASYQRGLEEGKDMSEANESENKVSESEVTEKVSFKCCTCDVIVKKIC